MTLHHYSSSHHRFFIISVIRHVSTAHRTSIWSFAENDTKTNISFARKIDAIRIKSHRFDAIRCIFTKFIESPLQSVDIVMKKLSVLRIDDRDEAHNRVSIHVTISKDAWIHSDDHCLKHRKASSLEWLSSFSIKSIKRGQQIKIDRLRLTQSSHHRCIMQAHKLCLISVSSMRDISY